MMLQYGGNSKIEADLPCLVRCLPESARRKHCETGTGYNRSRSLLCSCPRYPRSTYRINTSVICFFFFSAPWTTWILIAGFLFFGLEVWVTETLVHPFKSFLKTYLASKRLVPLTFAEQNISLVLVPPPQGALHSPGGPVTQAYPPEEPGKLLSNQLF